VFFSNGKAVYLLKFSYVTTFEKLINCNLWIPMYKTERDS